MADKASIDLTIKELAKTLVEGDRKKALSIIRSRINQPFDNDYQQLVWKGWERGLNRQENNALIHQMLAELSPKDAKKVHQDLRRKKSEILVRDHTQTDLSDYYLSTWISLLEIYCNILHDKN